MGRQVEWFLSKIQDSNVPGSRRSKMDFGHASLADLARASLPYLRLSNCGEVTPVMQIFKANDTLSVRYVESAGLVAGEVYNLDLAETEYTLVAHFFAYRFENNGMPLMPHTRINCFVLPNPINAELSQVAKALETVLIEQEVCSEPILLMVHKAEQPEVVHGEVMNWEFFTETPS